MTADSPVTYRHVQVGWLLIGLLGALLVPLLIGIAVPQTRVWCLFVGAFIVGIILLFGSLTVELDGERLRLSFGIGLIRRSFPLSMIRGVETVRNRWYYGWGIRWTPHGWLFNVSGFDAVQIEMIGGSAYRIGTDDPRRLSEAIRAAAPLAR